MAERTQIKSPQPIVYISVFETPLGFITVLADKQALYLLEFTDCKGIENEINRVCEKTSSTMLTGTPAPIHSIQEEMSAYFKGTLKHFRTPLHFLGSTFQVSVWNELRQIPYGQTRSYANVAAFLGSPTAYRAVAQANSKNHLAIIVPCHRIINNNGALGGFGRGLDRKEWLINHERNFI